MLISSPALFTEACLKVRTRLVAAVIQAVCAVALSLPALGQFETRSSFAMPGKAPYSAAVGDFNHDGNLDLAVVSYLPTGTVNILLGNGDGTFHPGKSYSVAVQPFFAAATSLRRNGILDLVVSDSLSEYVYVMLGNSDGTFQSSAAYPTIGEPFAVSTGDFTGDGIPDIVALTEPGGPCDCVEVMPGKGDGTFGDAIDTTVPYNVDGLALAVGHFTRNKDLDVAVTGEFGSATQADILLGNGDGTFRPNGYYPVVISPNSVAVGDFTGSKMADIAVAVDSGVEFLLGEGDGVFQQAVLYPTNFPTWVTTNDFTGDGKLDLAVSNASVTGYLAGASVLKGNGDGTFGPAAFYPVGRQAGFIASGDFNNDGKPDLVTIDSASDAVFALLNTGLVSFSPTTPLNFKNQAVGTTSVAQKVTLTNAGKSGLKISSMKASSQFAMKSSCGPNVAAGASCSISVTFSPTSTGSKSGTVTINNSASSRPMVIELTGTGT